MKDFIIMLLGMITLILILSTGILLMYRESVDISDCKKYEHISGIKTASFDGTCYRFVNDKFIEVNFEELDK